MKFVRRASGWIYQIKSGTCEKVPHLACRRYTRVEDKFVVLYFKIQIYLLHSHSSLKYLLIITN